MRPGRSRRRSGFQRCVVRHRGGRRVRAGRRAAGHVGVVRDLAKAPILGRPFTAEEDKPGADKVVLLSEGFWERRFGRDPKVLGRSLSLSGESFTVIGVMPGGLHGGFKTIDVFTPLLRTIRAST